MTFLCIISISSMASVMTKLYPTVKKQLCVVQEVNGPPQHLDLKMNMFKATKKIIKSYKCLKRVIFVKMAITSYIGCSSEQAHFSLSFI